MAKMFKIADQATGESLELTKAQWGEARNTAAQCPEEYIFSIYGEAVSRSVFLEFCANQADKAWKEKNKTHKLVWKQYGVSAQCTNSWHQIWVRR